MFCVVEREREKGAKTDDGGGEGRPGTKLSGDVVGGWSP